MKHGWPYKKVKDVCEKGSSNIQQNKIVNINGEYAVYGASGYVQNVDFYHQKSPYIGIVKDGSGVGRVNVYPAKTSLLGTMQYIIPKPCVSMGYIAYALKGLNLSKFASGAAIPHIYFRDYGECNVPVPSMDIQNAICKELDALSLIIEKKKEQIKCLDELSQAIFYDMFGDPVENNKGWNVKTLGNLSVKIANGYNAKLEEDTYKSEGIMYFRCQNVWRNRFDYSDLVYIDEATNRMMKSSSLKHNDLLITKIGRVNTENSSLGRVSLYEGEDDKANLSGNLCFVRLKNEVNCKFVLYILVSNQFRDYIRRTTVGGIDKRALNVKQISSFPIIQPPITEQEKYASRVEAIERQKELINQSILEAQTLLDARMDYWFGE